MVLWVSPKRKYPSVTHTFSFPFCVFMGVYASNFHNLKKNAKQNNTGPRTLCNACGLSKANTGGLPTRCAPILLTHTYINVTLLVWAKLAKQNGKQHVDTSSSQRNSWVSHNGVKLSPQLIPRSRSPCHVEPVPSRTPTTTSESNAASANKCAISYLLS